jgi:preprotein translocase subunit SecD
VRIPRLVATWCATIVLWTGAWSVAHVGAQSSQKQRWCLSIHEVHPSMTALLAQRRGVPAGYRIYPSPEDFREKEMLLREEPVIHGGDMADAQAGVDPRTNFPIIWFRLTYEGAGKFLTFTENNIGHPFAIVVEGRVVSAPVIQEPIRGAGQISGNFTPESAEQLAARIRSGVCGEFIQLPATRLTGTA